MVAAECSGARTALPATQVIRPLGRVVHLVKHPVFDAEVVRLVVASARWRSGQIESLRGLVVDVEGVAARTGCRPRWSPCPRSCRSAGRWRCRAAVSASVAEIVARHAAGPAGGEADARRVVVDGVACDRGRAAFDIDADRVAVDRGGVAGHDQSARRQDRGRDITSMALSSVTSSMATTEPAPTSIPVPDGTSHRCWSGCCRSSEQFRWTVPGSPS